MKNFISAQDVNDIHALLKKALEYKAYPLKDKLLGINKRIGLVFLNPSMRTRLSTQIAAANLGMEAIVFNVDKDGWKMEFEDGALMNGTSAEHVKDAAPVMGAYFDILCIRTFPSLENKEEDYSEQIINQFIKYAGVPVVSLESATLHPLQSFADIITIHELFREPRKPKVVLSWAPHIKPLPQCVSNSFAQWIIKWGMADFVITHPRGYELDSKFTAGATIDYNQANALEQADFVYVKNWSTYNDYGKVKDTNPDWMLTKDHMLKTNNAKVMHCLPVRRNVELSDEILDSTDCVVNQQAANRVWAAQTILSELLKATN